MRVVVAVSPAIDNQNQQHVSCLHILQQQEGELDIKDKRKVENCKACVYCV